MTNLSDELEAGEVINFSINERGMGNSIKTCDTLFGGVGPGRFL